MAYIGVSPSNGVRQKHTYTATASQTTFSGAGAEGISLSYRDSNYVDVYRNGVKLGDADYTATSGTSIVLGEGAAVSDIIEIVTYDVFSVADTVSKADGGTFDGNVTMAGTLAVTGETTLATHLNMGDSDIIKLGASADLQLFHDGSNSYVKDVGAGSLILTSDGVGVNIQKGTSELMAQFIADGANIFKYDNSTKLQTTSTGIDVTGTAVTDGLTVAGNVSVDGGTIKLDGNYPTGTGNVALGDTALDSLTSANFNTGIGHQALTGATSGGNNTALGAGAGSGLTTGVQNVMLGRSSGVAITSGNYNTSVGGEALKANTTASANTALGYQAGYSNTTGNQVTFVGGSAGYSNTTANYTTAIGNQSLYSNTTGSQNVAVGQNSQYNTTTGGQNVSVGSFSLDANTTGNYNTALGDNALGSNTTASANTAVGFQALQANTTGDVNVAVGSYALTSNTTASENTAFGHNALQDNTTGAINTAIGRRALANNTTASNNVAVGKDALFTNTTADNNTAVGQGAVYSNTTGASNTGVGREVLYNNTTGQNNSALGFQALSSNTTGQFNIAIGSRALNSNTTAVNNTAVGYQASYSQTVAGYNTSVGYQAGYSYASGAGNGFNTMIGLQSGYSNTGYQNTFVGHQSGYYVTSGAKNVILGGYNGNAGGLDIRTSDNQIVLSDGDGNPRLRIDSSARIQTSQAYGNNSDGTFNITENLGARACISLRSNASSNSGNFVLFTSDNGSNAGEITHTGATSISYAATSDYRLKNNVTYTFDATTRLKQLKPARFSWTHDTTNTLIDGFLAHEVQSVVPEAVNRAKDAVKVWKDGEELPDGVSVGDNKLDEDGNTIPDYQTMDMSKMIPLLVKTIQELEARITTLEGA